ncbi:NADH dehydrogenase [ubiquinone] 1 beta subcomplex subunit 1 [Sceloporus undulatus]|uniref:NADH dehydrogenase [ubiquinone] 1 beta subcomplex subunit 1 n=1 Tax=Sceloporus undulatus TaxID=8520 RepID=UPI001C4D4568|nr:NADH dehydrogenase [ubiquinone] 1 beta subcomplex subunit 1 [Sceloporus undulatus]
MDSSALQLPWDLLGEVCSAECCQRQPSFGAKAWRRVTMVNIIQIVRDHWAATLVPIAFVVGCYFDRRNDEKLALYRNKSKLFQRELKPGEEVTWK